MKVHTNTYLGVARMAVMRARVSYPPLADAWFTDYEEHGSRTHERRIDFHLVAESRPGRRRKRNFQQKHHEGVVALTYYEWGMILRELFFLDPAARVQGSYNNAEHFHEVTKGAFEPHPWTVEHEVACGGCSMPEEVIDAALRTWPPSAANGR